MLLNPGTLLRLALCATMGLASGAGATAPTVPVSPMSSTQFKDAVASEKRPIVVLFYAGWAGSSQALRASLAKAAVDYGGQARFVELNMDRAMEVAATYEVRGVPALLLLDQGRLVNVRTGAASEEELRGWIDAGLDAVSGSPPEDP